MKTIYQLVLTQWESYEGLCNYPTILGQFEKKEKALEMLNTLKQNTELFRTKPSIAVEIKLWNPIEEVYSEDEKSFTFIDTTYCNNTVEVLELEIPETKEEALSVAKDILEPSKYQEVINI